MNTMMPAATADVKREFARKVEKKMFAPVARHLREDLVEDRLAEGVGMAFEQYVQQRGRGPADGGRAAGAGVSHAGHRPWPPPGGCPGARPRERRLRRAGLQRGPRRAPAPRRPARLGRQRRGAGPVRLGRARRAEPGPHARQRHRSRAVARQARRRRPDDLALRQAGHTLGGIGGGDGRSTSTVFARLRQLGEELAEVAGVEIETGRAA